MSTINNKNFHFILWDFLQQIEESISFHLSKVSYQLYSRQAFELSYVVRLIESMISYSFPPNPAFRIRCFKVSSLVQLYYAATYGKNVALQFLPLQFDLITMPCLPTSHYKAFFPSWKLTNKDTPTFSNFTSFICTGSNLSSSKAEIKEYLPKIVDNCAGAKVPMHPLRSSLIFHVTKMGTFGSDSVLGQGGKGWLVSLATRVSKQYLQCYFVAQGQGFIIRYYKVCSL